MPQLVNHLIKLVVTIKNVADCTILQHDLNAISTFLQPHLEYAAQVWNQYRVRHVKAIESVQRIATKLVNESKQTNTHSTHTNTNKSFRYYGRTYPGV